MSPRTPQLETFRRDGASASERFGWRLRGANGAVITTAGEGFPERYLARRAANRARERMAEAAADVVARDD